MSRSGKMSRTFFQILGRNHVLDASLRNLTAGFMEYVNPWCLMVQLWEKCNEFSLPFSSLSLSVCQLIFHVDLVMICLWRVWLQNHLSCAEPLTLPVWPVYSADHSQQGQHDPVFSIAWQLCSDATRALHITGYCQLTASMTDETHQVYNQIL